MRKHALRIVSCLSVLALAACVTVAPGGQAGTIKIGFIGPLTGDAASYGVDALNGMKIKVDAINAAGGIDGKTVEVIAEDAKCTGADAAAAAQKLVNVDKVVAIVGGQCSGETLAAAPIAEAGKVVMVSPISSSPDVTEAGEFIFRDYPSDALKTKAMAAYFREKGLKKVAMISENTDFATGFRTALKSDVGESAFVFDEVVDPGTKDYRTLMTRLKALSFDIFVANGQTPATIAVMVQQMREQGVKQVAITHDAGQAEETITVGGEAVEGFLAITIPLLGPDTDFGKEYISRFGQPRSAMAFAGHAHDAMGVIAKAIDEVGTDGTAIRDYLYRMSSYTGVVGTFSFDDNGDVLGIPYALFVVKDGEWVTLQNIATN